MNLRLGLYCVTRPTKERPRGDYSRIDGKNKPLAVKPGVLDFSLAGLVVIGSILEHLTDSLAAIVPTVNNALSVPIDHI